MTAPAGYVDDPRFSRTFELPADPANGRSRPFKVQYADYGYRNEAHPEQETVLLFFGGMVGSRLLYITKDTLARKHKIRIIHPDRPGIGGTDAVEPLRLMQVWLDAIPPLLRHLGIQHVILAAHSGGTIFALDMLLHHPEILSPSRPYLALGAPWILPAHTSSKLMAFVKALPPGAIGQTDKLARLMGNHIGPSLGICFGVSQAVASKFVPTSASSATEAAGSEEVKLEEALWPNILERIYANGVRGISKDALLLMQKHEGMDGWSDWGDYDTLLPRLADTLRSTGKRLTVEVLYAEHDYMIGDGGTKGPLWFDQCWNQCGGDTIEYRSTVIKGADHDRIWNLRWGAVQKVFETIGQPPEETASSNAELVVDAISAEGRGVLVPAS